MRFLAGFIGLFVVISATPFLGNTLNLGDLVSKTTTSVSDITSSYGNVNFLVNDVMGGFGNIGQVIQGPIFQRGLASLDSFLSGYDRDSIHQFTANAIPIARSTFNDYGRIRDCVSDGIFDDRIIVEMERAFASIGNNITQIGKFLSHITGSNPRVSRIVLEKLGQSVHASLQAVINEARNQLRFRLRQTGSFDFDIIWSVFLSTLAGNYERQSRTNRNFY